MRERRAQVMVGAVFGFCVAVGIASLPLATNKSPSIPMGLYFVTPGPVERGAVVELCVGRFWEVASARGYLGEGLCPGELEPVVKVVAGMPGDVVTVSEGLVMVNDDALRNSERLHRDSAGREVPFIGSGTYVLGPDEVWVAGTEVKAMDSRIYGPVSLSQVRCCYRPVVILGALEVVR